MFNSKFATCVCVATITMLLTGCSSDEPKKEMPPIQPGVEMTQWLDCCRESGLDMMRQLVTDSPAGNVTFSPLSMYTSLSMTAAGADGVCADELGGLLNFSNRTLLNEYLNNILVTLPNLDNRTTISMANSVWVDESLDINPSYSDDVTAYYGAEVLGCDLGNPEATATINKWISDKTRGLIPEHLNRNEELGVLCLVNALYFKAPWSDPFSTSATQPADFKRADGSKVEVQMMQDPAKYAYYAEVDGTQILTLPFGNGRFSMSVFLPAQGEDLRKFVLNNPIYSLAALADKNQMHVNISLPKFEAKSKIDAKAILQNMGVTEIFEPHPWPSLTGSQDELKINKITQSVCLKIDENGGEGSASSSVTFGDAAMMGEKTFKADRPFFYMITENACNIPIFMGTIESF